MVVYYFSKVTLQDIVKLEPKKGDKWPVGRACHAACCLGYGSDNPSLFVIGGGTTDERILQDAWIFDIAERAWREVS